MPTQGETLSTAQAKDRFQMPVLIWYAVALHLIWGMVVLLDIRATEVTALAGLRAFSPSPRVLGITLLAIGGGAAFACVRHRHPLALPLLLPQQFALTLSSFNAIIAVGKRAYPDGTRRPWAFIFVDQLPAILLGALHTVAVLRLYGRVSWSDIRNGFCRWRRSSSR